MISEVDPDSLDWLVIGLGNPGLQYEQTRHNLGFMVVDQIAEEAGIKIKRDECRSLIGNIPIGNVKAELAKPQTFMNLSGESVACLLKKPSRSIAKLVVISDDLALPFGSIRIRPKGTHGGHNGLRSIIDRTGSNEFIRLRIGILPDHPIMNTKDFVLQRFAKAESEKLPEVLKVCADAVRAIILDGVDKAMAKFN